MLKAQDNSPVTLNACSKQCTVCECSIGKLIQMADLDDFWRSAKKILHVFLFIMYLFLL